MSVPGQQAVVSKAANGSTASRSLRLNVVVAPKAGSPVAGLQQGDFTLLDNKVARPITSFRQVGGAQEPLKVIVVIDAVNTNFDRVAYERDEIKKFLKANGGQLAHPTTVAVLMDTGTQISKGFTNDGNALSDAIDHYTIGLREIRRDSGIWGANDRVDISLKAVNELTTYAATIPGRKVVFWVSPGWPLLSGDRVDLDGKQEQQIFTSVIAFSKQLQQANLTLYSVNPLGPEENLFRENFYEQFVKGVSKPSQTDLADLSLQVLAVQSGGLALNGSSDVAGSLRQCIADTETWYEITFDVPVAERANEYHHVQVNVDKPGLIGRTRDGYYAQP